MSKTRITVRDATLADVGVIAPLLGELGYPVDGNTLTTRMRLMLARDDQRILIAESADGALGLLALHVFPALAYDGSVALIMALVVTAEARGLGVGRALIDHCDAAARSLGATRLLVTTHVRRADAHAFYERLGFEFTGRRYVRAIA